MSLCKGKFRWAGVDGVSPTSRGSYIDGRALGFLEGLMGQDFLQRGYSSNPLGFEAGYDLVEAYQIALNHVYARLVAQGAGGALLAGDWHYAIASDAFVGVTGLDLDVLDDLEGMATGLSDTAARELFWSNVLRMVEFAVGVDALSSGDRDALRDAVYNSDNALDMDDLAEGLHWSRPMGVDEEGTNGDDVMYGSSGDDVLRGGYGNDTLYGLGGPRCFGVSQRNNILLTRQRQKKQDSFPANLNRVAPAGCGNFVGGWAVNDNYDGNQLVVVRVA